MKQFTTSDGLEVWHCLNGSVGVSIGFDSCELDAKEVGKLIIYLTKLLMKGIVK